MAKGVTHAEDVEAPARERQRLAASLDQGCGAPRRACPSIPGLDRGRSRPSSRRELAALAATSPVPVATSSTFMPGRTPRRCSACRR